MKSFCIILGLLCAGIGSSIRAEECENNDTLSEAALIQPADGLEISGSIDPAGDLDYFRLESPGGERIWAGTVADDDTVLYLLDDEGSILESDDDDGSGLCSLLAGAHLEDPGTYYLLVKGYSDEDTFSYSLYVSLYDGLDMVAETGADNDTAGAAQEVSLNHWISGSFTASSDVDWYEFTAGTGKLLTFILDDNPARDGTGSFDSELKLYSSSGSILLEEVDHEGTGPDEPEDLYYYNFTSRTLWLAVSNDNTSSFTPGNYALAVSVAEDHACIGTPTPSPTPSPLASTPSPSPSLIPTASTTPSAPPPPSPSPSPPHFLIHMQDNSYKPRIVRIDPGQTVTWRNEGVNLHTSTSDAGLWNSGTMLPKALYSRPFPSIGIYDYHCEFHPLMVGRIICGFATPTPPPTPLPSPSPTATEAPENASVDSDYDGDGTGDLAIFRRTGSLWKVRGVTSVYFGTSDDEPVPADFDGDGDWDFAYFRPSSGFWKVRGLTVLYFGTSDDEPVPADFDGNGSDDFAYHRPSSGLWKVRGFTSLYFGTAEDSPLDGDFDGNGTADFAYFRASNALWKMKGLTSLYFGTSDDEPVPADFDGDGSTDPAYFRSSSGLWKVKGLTSLYFGTSEDIPVPADHDGDGSADFAYWRPASILWKIKGITRVYFGNSDDSQVTNPW